MRSKIVIVVMLFLIALMPGAMPSAQAVPRGTAGETGQSSQTNIVETYAKLPLLFVHNQGQLDSQVEYYVKTPRQTVYLTPSGMVFDLIRYQNTGTADSADRKAERFAFSLDFVGGNASPLIQGVTQDKAVVNYFIGNDPDKWHTDIATYREVLYKDVYPGIDLRLYGKENALEYEFVVQPGADVSDIALAYSGVDGLNLESNGLVVSTVFGELKQSQPCIYQQIGDDTVAVAGGFSLLGADSYGFEVGAYDAGYPLIIDPSLALAYSTYLGGSDEDRGFGIAVESGCAYVTGETVSADFPTKNEYQTDPVDSNWDAFVAKIDTTQSGTASLIYSTYLGGSLDDYGRGIAVEAGCAYITGDTPSANFPASTQAQIASPQDAPPTSGRDVFVVRLNAAGDGITYSYRLRGDGDDYGRGIAVESGYAYVTGDTDSTNFRTEHQYQTDQVGIDAFVAKLDTSLSGGSSVIYSTYLGGNGSDEGRGIAVDSNGCAYVTGDTFSTDFPTVSPYQAERNGFYFDAFVAKLDTSQTGEGSLIYSTYLGGDSADHGRGIDVESGCAYVAGDTGSADFPTKNEYRADQGNWDAFVTKIDTNQIGDNSLIYSTYLGGSGDDAGYGIAVESGCACVTGDTLSTDFPTVNEYQGDRNGMDAFVSKLDTNQTGDNSLICSSYLGGSFDDHGRGIAAESGCAYVTGDTSSTDFPNLNQYQTDQGGWDAFVAKFGATAPWVVGGYSTKCSIKFYDWRCNKWIIVKGGTLYITSQVENKVEGYWQPDVAIERWKTLIPVDGYVGPIHRDAKGKIKNTPRLSLLLQAGEYCMYGTGPNASYVTYILNAKIKMDKKTEKVKSIKGAINGWGEYGTPFADIGGPSQGQFEGKFTATPVPAGPPAAGEGGAEYVEYAPSASEMPQPGAPADALSMIPNVLGDYPIKGSIKFYDWKCNKSIVVQSGILHVTWQADNKIEGYWQPIPAIDGWPALSPEFVGYVGPFYRDDKGKIKNTPRLSLLWEGGTYCAYPDEPYVTYILNAKVKVDRKTEPPLVKSIKGSINGWGEWGAPFSDNTSSLGQFEGKFTATPPLVP